MNLKYWEKHRQEIINNGGKDPGIDDALTWQEIEDEENAEI